jgi:hypothetical protein
MNKDKGEEAMVLKFGDQYFYLLNPIDIIVVHEGLKKMLS